MSTMSRAPETEAPSAEPSEPSAPGGQIQPAGQVQAVGRIEAAGRIDPVAEHKSTDEFWGADTGATTAEYAITTLAACGFAALLVVILKSEPIKELVTGVIQTALGMGS